jgi:putative addiction module CopG family antidote
MKISLSPELQRLIAEKVSSGRYQSADEVVREGLQLLQQRENATLGFPLNHGDADFAAAFETIAGDVSNKDWEGVPADLSKNIDHYLYGSRKAS